MVALAASHEIASPPSVLITDDNDGWRQAVEDVLESAGFHTLQASSGEEAIEVVRTRRLDVVLLDFHMPRLDGLQTLRRMRRHNCLVPAVLMTAHPTSVPVEVVRSLRVRRVLRKPADRGVIVTTVTQVVHWQT